MKIGMGMPGVGQAISEAGTLSTFAARLEELGFDSLWGAERLITPLAPATSYPGAPGEYDENIDTFARSADPLLDAVDPHR